MKNQLQKSHATVPSIKGAFSNDPGMVSGGHMELKNVKQLNFGSFFVIVHPNKTET